MLCENNIALEEDGYIEQSIRDLCIIVGSSKFHLSDDGKSFFVEDKEEDVFTIHGWSEFSCGDFQISKFILGESHAVMIRYEFQIIFFEICACTKLKNQETVPLFLKDLKDEEVFGRLVNGHTYALKKKYLNQSELMETYDYFDVLIKLEHATLLECNFCDTTDCDHGVEPMTKLLVWVDEENKKVYIYSIHVYPEETDKSKIAVLTESVIKVNL